MMICGSGTLQELWIEERIKAMDAFVFRRYVEENRIVSMFANRTGVKESITQIERENLTAS